MSGPLCLATEMDSKGFQMTPALTNAKPLTGQAFYSASTERIWKKNPKNFKIH